MEILFSLLDEIVNIFGQDKATFEKYIEIFKTGLKEIELGKIPMTIDQVVVGDVDRSRSHKCRAIYIIGLNDGVFPSINKQEGFLDDLDREKLKKLDIELAKTTEAKMYEDQFNIYKALTSAEEKMFLSYTSSSMEGSALQPSILVLKIKKIFIKLYEKSDIINKQLFIGNVETTFEELLYNIRLFQDGKKIDSIWFDIYRWYSSNKDWEEKLESVREGLKYINSPRNINKDLVGKLYGDTLKTSVSKLEQYRKCPFSFHMQYGLKLQEESTFKIKPIDTGSFMHEVIDDFFEEVKRLDIDIKAIEQEKAREIVNNIINEKLELNKNYIFVSNQKFMRLTKRLKEVIYQSIENIVYQLKSSEFDVFDTEVEFKSSYRYPPITLQLEDGKKIEITVKIDRIDIAKFNNKKHVRIIDYKSSVKDIDLNEFISGLQIQLITYLDAITKVEDVLPAGMLYFNLIDPIINSGTRKMSEQDIKDQIRKKFKMNGIVLADIDIIKMMDKHIENSTQSDIIPVYVDSKGEISNKKSNAINKEQFGKLQKYANKIIKQISKEILSGDIGLKPYYNSGKTACEYCAYKSICGFNRNVKGNDYRYVDKINKSDIMEEIEKNNAIL